MNNLRHAFPQLARSPGFSAGAGRACAWHRCVHGNFLHRPEASRLVAVALDDQASFPYHHPALRGDLLDCSEKYTRKIDACRNQAEQPTPEMDRAKYLAKDTVAVDPLQSSMLPGLILPPPIFIRGIEIQPAKVALREQPDLLVHFVPNSAGQVQFS
jgi:hypothetical protein